MLLSKVPPKKPNLTKKEKAAGKTRLVTKPVVMKQFGALSLDLRFPSLQAGVQERQG